MSYPVYVIESEWVQESEQLGTKDKFWLKPGDGSALHQQEWLFKYPTEGTGQHWAEKIAYEIARKMHILAPKVELATIQGDRGSITANFTIDGYDLFHGNQILAGFTPQYDTQRFHGQNDHTIHQILAAIGGSFKNQETAEDAKLRMSSYLVLDALICNVDRHHENWGILKRLLDGHWVGKLAPSYDHASSLGRELRDTGSKQNRERYLRELGVGKYIERGHGPIFMDGTGRRGPSPLRLIERCLDDADLAPYFEQSLKKLERVDDADFRLVVEEVPEGWMSELAQEFTLSLLSECLSKLKSLT